MQKWQLKFNYHNSHKIDLIFVLMKSELRKGQRIVQLLLDKPLILCQIYNLQAFLIKRVKKILEKFLGKM